MGSRNSQEDLSVKEEARKQGASDFEIQSTETAPEKSLSPRRDLPQYAAETSAGAIPNGGLQAWLHVLGGFMLFFNTCGILNAFGVFQTYWQVLLAQGFCVGIGAGCLFVPGIAILPTYFNTKLSLAVVLGAAGSSFGGIIYPIVLYQLIDRVGFGWSVRVIGFIALGTLLIPIAVMKMRYKPPKSRALIDWSAFTDIFYMMFTMATLIGFMGLYTILFYLSYYAVDRHVTNTKMAFYLVPIFNAASCFGRTIPNALSDKTGPLILIAPGASIVGALILCMIAV